VLAVCWCRQAVNITSTFNLLLSLLSGADGFSAFWRRSIRRGTAATRILHNVARDKNTCALPTRTAGGQLLRLRGSAPRGNFPAGRGCGNAARASRAEDLHCVLSCLMRLARRVCDATDAVFICRDWRAHRLLPAALRPETPVVSHRYRSFCRAAPYTLWYAAPSSLLSVLCHYSL